MKFWFSILILLFPAYMMAQVRPDLFPEETAPDNTNFEVYSQKGGTVKRAGMDALRTYFGAEIVGQVAPPALFGNPAAIRNKYVRNANGDIWFVDYTGAAIFLGVLDDSISDHEMNYDSVTISDFVNDAGFLTSEVDGDLTNEIEMSVQNTSNKIYPIAAVIRFHPSASQSDDFNYWKLIPGHTPLGIWNSDFASSELEHSVETTTTEVRIYYKNGITGVGSIIVGMDETLSKTGLRAGCSVGTDFAKIRFYRDGWGEVTIGGTVNSINKSKDGGFIKSVTWNASTTSIDIYHYQCGAANVTVGLSGSNADKYYVKTNTISDTITSLTFYELPYEMSGYINYNGSSFECSSCFGMTLGTFQNGFLDINLSRPSQTFNQSINSRGLYDVAMGSNNSTLIRVGWRDRVTGEVITTANSEMKTYVNASNSSTLVSPHDLSVDLRWSSSAVLDPHDIEPTPSGNVWIIGTLTK